MRVTKGQAMPKPPPCNMAHRRMSGIEPAGMPQPVVKRLHDAFKLAIDDPEHLKTLQQLDQLYWYKSSEDYAKWAAETFKAERATIERVGLLLK